VSVRLSLLAILDQGSCYGYQLRAEYERRTATSGLNVGQIYTTLERLERDRLVARGTVDERGHVFWSITPRGSEEVAAWFAAVDERDGRDDLVHKITLAATLPGVDAQALVAAQHAQARTRLERCDAEPAPGDIRDRIAATAARARAAADAQWLGAVAAMLAVEPSAAESALSDERPRRGRPLRSGAG
jgi:DNA-binding PadR family transcriptional regulator